MVKSMEVYVKCKTGFKILMLFELFGLVSGAKLNKQNIFGMWLGQWRGRWRGRSGQSAGLHWTSKGRV